jgi:hypothetical protein
MRPRTGAGVYPPDNAFVDAALHELLGGEPS